MNCKMVPIMQLEILKKKYPKHIFHKQNIYNAIYKLHQSNINKKLDITLMLDILLKKILQDSHWKVYIQYAGNEH